MVTHFRTALLVALSFFISWTVNAQIIEDPSEWKFEAKKKKGNEYDLIFHVNVKNGYHIYSLDPGGDGSFPPPEFNFTKGENFKLNGKVTEKGQRIDETIEDIGTVHYFKKVDYIQPATITANGKITGKYSYMTCNEQGCLPPKTKSFTFTINDPELASGTDTVSADTAKADSLIGAAITPAAGMNTTHKAVVEGASADDAPKEEKKSLLWLFFMALAGGFAAVLTPCVYSMIPITVSFFTKRSKTRAEGIRNAIYYSLSIIIIFTILGVLISVMFGGNALNNLSTNWIANLFFFIIFVIFGISFLGAFEITLPSSWTSTTDSKAGLSSFGGIFFMALTLVIVSFSCTGPIVGPLLVIAGKGGIAGPMLGMFGFSIGLAMPFAIFAIFPGLLNKMAASGGWLNQVKVVLGFLELMLALKFLSNADLAMGWRLLDREIFIAIWIVLAILLGFYLLGRLKLSHDDATPKNIYGQEYVSIFRLFLAICSFTFALYLFPGMWGAPLNGMSQFVPPMGTQDFVIGAGGSGASHGDASTHSDNGVAPVKYVEEMRIYEPPVVKNLGLVTYFEYEEAIAAAKILKKPIMLDFTGINCVNCRKMESQVWSKPEVAQRLKNDFIVASLYCDYDKKDLPAKEQYYSQALQADVVTVGDRNEDLQAAKFNSNSQPFYFFIDENGNKLAEEGYPYDPDVQKFVKHLDRVKEKYAASVK
ncbi:protein-disulfide reductase DsbD family protein [Polluticoccus soli]|uniref:protein-disulfide reductase DsbD family protein n=1 Tax=Polluticoccus soli TaxID=3034150 RepID=UPI0023E1E301|nr:cytochrome c biogenesis protein CcdA [Flavipsychrobacter sp. JY13-12]